MNNDKKALKFTVSPENSANRLDSALAEAYPTLGLRARRRLWEWCQITLDGHTALPGAQVWEGQVIEVVPFDSVMYSSQNFIDGQNAAQVKASESQCPPVAENSCISGVAAANSQCLRIVAASAEFCAIYKPAGLPSANIAGGKRQSAEGLVAANWGALASAWQKTEQGSAWLAPAVAPILCNRLDNETSGLLLWAFGGDKLEHFRALEAAGVVKKFYYALVEGEAPSDLFLDQALNTTNRAKTLVLARAEPDSLRHTSARFIKSINDFEPRPCSLLELMIRRGARHQIRAHLAAAGYPIVGDPLYGKENGTGLMYLHHFSIFFEGFSAQVSAPWK